MTSLKDELDALMDDENFVQATLQATGNTEKLGGEWEYRVIGNGGNMRIIGPNYMGEHNGYFESVDGEEIYLGHTHPLEGIPEPSQHDMDLVHVHSRRSTPIGAVWENDGKYAVGVAFRRAEPLAGIGYWTAFTRKVANACIQKTGLSDTGFTSSSYRRYESALRKNFADAEAGNMEYADVVPDALDAAGFEAVSMGIKKDYKARGQG